MNAIPKLPKLYIHPNEVLVVNSVQIQTGYMKMVLSQAGRSFLAIREVNSILCPFTKEAVHGN